MPFTAADMVADARRQIREVEPQEAQAMLDDGQDAVVIDVREPAEFETGHIAGAINVPRGVLEFQVEAHPSVACVTDPALSMRSRPLLLCCRNGGRAALAALALQQMGFSQALAIRGGALGWAEAGLALTTR